MRPATSTPRLPTSDALRVRIRQIVDAHPRCGYARVVATLDAEGGAVPRPLTRRLYDENFPRSRCPSGPRPAAWAAETGASSGARWRVVVIHGRLADQRIFRVVGVFDADTGACVRVETHSRIQALLLTEILDRAAETHGMPLSVTVDEEDRLSPPTLRAWATRTHTFLVIARPETFDDAAVATERSLRDALPKSLAIRTHDALDRHLQAWRDVRDVRAHPRHPRQTPGNPHPSHVQGGHPCIATA